MGKLLEADTDYVLEDKPQNTCWITVGNISVYIKREDEGVVVDLYAVGAEDRESLASTYAFNQEAEDFIQEMEEEDFA
jgi:hypothetical protein